MKQETKSNEEIVEEAYYQIIDPEIMDFQIHVREVTGGDDISMVDSTKLGIACRKALTQTLQAKEEEQLAEREAEVREEEREKAYKFVREYKEKYEGCGLADSMLALDELLKSLSTNTPKV